MVAPVLAIMAWPPLVIAVPDVAPVAVVDRNADVVAVLKLGAVNVMLPATSPVAIAEGDADSVPLATAGAATTLIVRGFASVAGVEAVLLAVTVYVYDPTPADERFALVTNVLFVPPLVMVALPLFGVPVSATEAKAPFVEANVGAVKVTLPVVSPTVIAVVSAVRLPPVLGAATALTVTVLEVSVCVPTLLFRVRV